MDWGRKSPGDLPREGARVVLHYYHNHAAALETQDFSPTVDSIVPKADLTKEEEVEGLFRAAEEKLGPVELLVANAGIWESQAVGIQDMTLSQWTLMLTTNLTSVFLCMREFFKLIILHRFEAFSAVIVGSTAGVFGEVGHADYAAT